MNKLVCYNFTQGPAGKWSIYDDLYIFVEVCHLGRASEIPGGDPGGGSST